MIVKGRTTVFGAKLQLSVFAIPKKSVLIPFSISKQFKENQKR